MTRKTFLLSVSTIFAGMVIYRSVLRWSTEIFGNSRLEDLFRDTETWGLTGWLLIAGFIMPLALYIRGRGSYNFSNSFLILMAGILGIAAAVAILVITS